MNNLYLDVNNLRNKLTNFNDNVAKYREKLDEIFQKNSEVSNFWFDNNVEPFKTMLEKDFNVFFAQCDNLKKQIESINSFCDNLESTIKLYMDINGLSSIRYNKNVVNNACGYLGETKKSINEAERFVRSMYIPSDVSISGRIRNIMNDVNESEIDEILEKLKGVSNGINDVVANSKSEIATLNVSEIDSSICEFRYKY